MSRASNRAKAKLASKRRGSTKRPRSRARRPTPSTAPYEAAAALTGDDIGDLQRAIEAAPRPEDAAQLDQAANDVERPTRVTIRGSCPHCKAPVTLSKPVTLDGAASIAGRLRALAERLRRFDGRVLQRLVDDLGEGASLWFTGKGG